MTGRGVGFGAGLGVAHSPGSWEQKVHRCSDTVEILVEDIVSVDWLIESRYT